MQDSPTWRPALVVAFRFAFCYIVLYAVYVLDAIVGTVARIGDPFPQPLLREVIVRLGELVNMGAALAAPSRGSGDTAFHWAMLLFNLALASIAATIWSVTDRKRREYRQLYGWLRLAVRMLLAFTLFGYGMVKVIPAQFGSMTPDRLATPYGQLVPMQVLWAFMASSPGYTMFTGWIEVSAGALLLVPRLATAGALLAAIALTNIFALNLFYDVPVKIYSFHLLLFAAFVALPDIPRLAAVLIFNRAALPSQPVRLFRNDRLEKAIEWAPFILAAIYLASLAHEVVGLLPR
jgi:uncharacterized membrane protein YphA (DoxX/SURF4 family)